jgi:Cu/Zn superoxide dismutase
MVQHLVVQFLIHSVCTVLSITLLTELMNSFVSNFLFLKGKSHGAPLDEQRMVGDLGNITVDESGSSSIHIVDSKIQLLGPHSIIGRSIVIYAGADDMGRGGHENSLITGNTGPRIAAGIIGLSL